MTRPDDGKIPLGWTIVIAVAVAVLIWAAAILVALAVRGYFYG